MIIWGTVKECLHKAVQVGQVKVATLQSSPLYRFIQHNCQRQLSNRSDLHAKPACNINRYKTIGSIQLYTTAGCLQHALYGMST